jgi:hypothetical protein
MRDGERLTHQRAMMRKVSELARAMLRECEAAEREPLTLESADRREIAIACLVRRAATLELQARRARQGAGDRL